MKRVGGWDASVRNKRLRSHENISKKRAVTNTLLGSFCSKNISTLIKKNEAFIVRENFNQENIVGYGYPIPYLDNLIKTNSNYLCLMPKNQGALNWPSKKNKTIMVEQTEWPLESEISDIAMIVHGL